MHCSFGHLYEFNRYQMLAGRAVASSLRKNVCWDLKKNNHSFLLCQKNSKNIYVQDNPWDILFILKEACSERLLFWIPSPKGSVDRLSVNRKEISRASWKKGREEVSVFSEETDEPYHGVMRRGMFKLFPPSLCSSGWTSQTNYNPLLNRLLSCWAMVHLGRCTLEKSLTTSVNVPFSDTSRNTIVLFPNRILFCFQIFDKIRSQQKADIFHYF